MIDPPMVRVNLGFYAFFSFTFIFFFFLNMYVNVVDECQVPSPAHGGNDLTSSSVVGVEELLEASCKCSHGSLAVYQMVAQRKGSEMTAVSF